jgi:hypothetical protein
MRVWVALLLLAGAACAQTPKADQKGTIHGVVKDTTGAPAVGITVSASHDPGSGYRSVLLQNGDVMLEQAGKAVTDEAGTFAFDELAPGTYSLKAERDPAAKVVKLDAGQEITVDFVIPANPVISGHVVDQNKDPVVDALVWLLKPEYQNGVLRPAVIGPKATGEDGSYSFDTNLEVNRRYYLLVDRPAPAELPNGDLIEVPTYYPSATRMDDAIAVVLQPGETREHVDIKVVAAPFYCVDGKVQSGGKPATVDFAITETPLAGARIDPLAEAVVTRLRGGSGEDGKYHFCGLPSGSYRLSTEQGFTEFTIAGTDVEHVDLSLDAAYPSVQIDWDEPLVTPEFPKLNPEAEELLHRIASLMGFGDNPSEDDLEKLALRLLQSDPKDTQRVEALSKMQGDSDFGRKMGSLMGALMPLRASWGVSLTGIDNRYFGSTSESVPAGDYIVNVGFPRGSYVKKVTFNDINLAGGVLRLAPAQSGTLHILLAHGDAQLSIAVADAEGKPVPNTTVMVVPESATSAAALSRVHTRGRTDQNGNFSVQSLAPGKYKVLATPQTVRWEVPEDLEKVLLVMFQANDVELDVKASAKISIAPIPIF